MNYRNNHEMISLNQFVVVTFRSPHSSMVKMQEWSWLSVLMYKFLIEQLKPCTIQSSSVFIWWVLPFRDQWLFQLDQSHSASEVFTVSDSLVEGHASQLLIAVETQYDATLKTFLCGSITWCRDSYNWIINGTFILIHFYEYLVYYHWRM